MLIVDIVERENLGLLGPGAVAFIKITDGQCVSLIFRTLRSTLCLIDSQGKRPQNIKISNSSLFLTKCPPNSITLHFATG